MSFLRGMPLNAVAQVPSREPVPEILRGVHDDDAVSFFFRRSVVALHYPSNTIRRVRPELAQCRQLLWSIGRGVGVPAS